MDPQLYKRKVTTITTEYYQLADNGTLALTSWTTNGSNGTTNGTTNGKTTGTGLYNTISPVPGWWPLPGQALLTDVTTFTNSIVSYFDTYGQKVANMINKTTGTDEELSLAEEDLFKDIEVIGSLVRPYYTAEFSEKLNQIMRGFALSQLQVISLVRAGLDINTWVNFRFSTILLTDISLMLNQFNNWWNQASVRSAWDGVVNAWIAAVKAKKNNNQQETDAQIAKASDLLKAFGLTLAQGIIYQNADKFTQPSSLPATSA